MGGGRGGGGGLWRGWGGCNVGVFGFFENFVFNFEGVLWIFHTFYIPRTPKYTQLKRVNPFEKINVIEIDVRSATS